MASKRFLKKDLKQMIYHIMDDCDFVIINDGDSSEDANKLMDDAVQFYESMLPRINSSKSKVEFRGLRVEIEKKAEEFILRLNQLY